MMSFSSFQRAAFLVDAWLCEMGAKGGPLPINHSTFQSSAGSVRYLDTASREQAALDGDLRPALLIIPDGPCVVPHFEEIAHELQNDWRVIVMDLPGFGLSFPAGSYSHSFDAGAAIILELLDHLRIHQPIVLCTSCVNGFYALRLAKLHRHRLRALVLAQTPSVPAMQAWSDRVVPWFIKVPVLGQIINYVGRSKFAATWFKIALDRTSPLLNVFTRISADSFAHSGSCFCLASVVQGTLPCPAALITGVDSGLPVHALWGQQDRSHRKTDPMSLLDLVPHAQMRVLPDAGHFPHQENVPILKEILAKILIDQFPAARL